MLWPLEYKEYVYRFLIEVFSPHFLKIPAYINLCNLYLKQITLNLQKKWERIFDYRLSNEKLNFKILKKTFRLRLTPVTCFLVRHLLHFKNDVDLVYCYCNSYDPKFRRKKTKALKKAKPNWTPNGLDKCRSSDNDELKYALRSAEKNAPWVRNIYIVTDEQKPEWLDTSNKKIKIVDLKDIIPKKYLPCFNSNVIESFLYKIKGMSEYFLYSNDDMFFCAPVTKDFFFSADGRAYARFYKMPATYKIIDSPYLQTLVRMARLYQKKAAKIFT